MKDSRYADTEIAVGVGAVTATLTETGVIASGGTVAGMVTQIGATTGMTVFANFGAGVASVCGALGPVGWIAMGIGGTALILHGIYRGS